MAELMGLENIQPYVSSAKNDPGILVNPRLTDFNDGILEHPISQDNYSNIIYIPEGKPFDTSTEFPSEKIGSWEDYLTVKNKVNSKELEKNMRNAGMGDKPTWYAAHHIVAWDDPRAKEARDILLFVNIDINDAENGVYFPHKEIHRVVNDLSTFHPIIHTAIYYIAINNKLRGITNRIDVINKLDEIRKLINTNKFPK